MDTSLKLSRSVRTGYDPRYLQGKGFVYIAPRTGPLAFGDASISPKVWTEFAGIRVQLMLLHELGHVFGVPHFGQPEELMSEDYADFVIKYQFKVWNNLPQSSVLHPWSGRERLVYCHNIIYDELNAIDRFFELSDTAVCFYATYRSPNSFDLSVSSFHSESLIPIGTIKLNHQVKRQDLTKIRVFVDKTKNLYGDRGSFELDIHAIEAIGDLYLPHAGISKPVTLSINPQGMTIGAVLDQRPVTDIFWYYEKVLKTSNSNKE